jgi:hypothetical protein
MFFKGIFNFINDIFTDQSPGTQRHLTYFKLIPKALFLNLPAFLLGYGAMNVGVSMEIVEIGILPYIENLISVWKGKWNPESMTVTFALMGDIIFYNMASTICFRHGLWHRQSYSIYNDFLDYCSYMYKSFII